MNVINFVGDAWEVRLDDGDPHEDALRIADALGKLVREVNPAGSVTIGYDTRPLSAALAREMGEVIAGQIADIDGREFSKSVLHGGHGCGSCSVSDKNC